jgi:hypothetical protein
MTTNIHKHINALVNSGSGSVSSTKSPSRQSFSNSSRIRWMHFYCRSVYFTPVSISCFNSCLIYIIVTLKNILTCFVLPILYRRCTHDVTYYTLPISAILLNALRILWQFKWSLAGGFVLRRRPPLQCILMIRGGQCIQTLL